MRTPLQVTIISLLLERRSRVPQDRFGLFESFYTTLYDRETNKGTRFSRLLQSNRHHIDYIHESVGLILQVRAGHGGNAESLLPLSELQEITVDRLKIEGFEDEAATRLANELVSAATERLVMLAALKAGHVGFEIRSLQELMAARALSTGSDAEVITRLETLARPAQWRNTWLFVASRLFAQRERLRDRVVNLLTVLDTESRFATFTATGSRLALELLDEDVAAQSPIFQRLLVQKSLEGLQFFPGEEIRRMARVLRDVALADPPARQLVDRAIDRGLETKSHSAVAALQMLQVLGPREGDANGPTYADARQRLTSAPGNGLDLAAAISVLERRRSRMRSRSQSAGQQSLFGPPALLQEIQRRRFAAPAKQRLDEIAQLLADQQLEALTPFLDDRTQQTLAGLIESIPLAAWGEAAQLRDQLIAWHEQRPVSNDTEPFRVTDCSGT